MRRGLSCRRRSGSPRDHGSRRGHDQRGVGHRCVHRCHHDPVGERKFLKSIGLEPVGHACPSCGSWSGAGSNGSARRPAPQRSPCSVIPGNFHDTRHGRPVSIACGLHMPIAPVAAGGRRCFALTALMGPRTLLGSVNSSCLDCRSDCHDVRACFLAIQINGPDPDWWNRAYLKGVLTEFRTTWLGSRSARHFWGDFSIANCMMPS